MKERIMICGKRRFDSTPVTATDPCYNKGTWCTVENIEIPEGEYRCCICTSNHWYNDAKTKKRIYYDRVSRNFVLNDSVNIREYPRLKRECIGEAGVDAGLCGFFQNKPDYDDDGWDAFCGKIDCRDYLITDDGFCSSSGYGDGCYPVYKLLDADGNVVGLELQFIW